MPISVLDHDYISTLVLVNHFRVIFITIYPLCVGLDSSRDYNTMYMD